MTNKDLISQYVDTGLRLPEYQVMKLSNQDRKTYLRKRLFNKVISDFEFALLSDEQKTKYLDTIMKNAEKYLYIISRTQFNALPDGKIKDKLKKDIQNNIEGTLLAGQKLTDREKEFINIF